MKKLCPNTLFQSRTQTWKRNWGIHLPSTKRAALGKAARCMGHVTRLLRARICCARPFYHLWPRWIWGVHPICRERPEATPRRSARRQHPPGTDAENAWDWGHRGSPRLQGAVSAVSTISALHFLSPSPITVPVLAKLCSAAVSGIEASPVWRGQGEGSETVPGLLSAISFWRLFGRKL
jgi:hypothetical protein